VWAQGRVRGGRAVYQLHSQNLSVEAESDCWRWRSVVGEGGVEAERGGALKVAKGRVGFHKWRMIFDSTALPELITGSTPQHLSQPCGGQRIVLPGANIFSSNPALLLLPRNIPPFSCCHSCCIVFHSGSWCTS